MGTGVKNPVVIAWWSAAFPGFGHLILGNYLIGLILIVHEIVINSFCGLNTAVFYSFIGEFKLAKEALDVKWLLAYVAPYIFAIWDSYQRTVRLNANYLIALQRNDEIIIRENSVFSLNRLDMKKPVVAVLWSYLAPGSGHLYINRILLVLIVPFLVAITYFSNLLPAVHHMMTGNFQLSRSIVDFQWLLYLPSIYGFMAYDVYIHTLENNKLYKMHLKSYLKRRYQNRDFQLDI